MARPDAISSGQWRTVTIKAIDAKDVIYCNDIQGVEIQLPPFPEWGRKPFVGEVWLVNRPYGGHWALQACLQANLPAVVGSRANPLSVLPSLLEALSAAGLINDQTTS